MRLALAQINTVVGDLDGNRARILAHLDEARAAGADLVLFPELAVTGYPPEDLLLRPGFMRAARRSVDEIARDDGASPRSSVPRISTPTSTTRCFVLAHGRFAASTASVICRTTASSTRTATSRPATTCRSCGSATCSSGRRSARTSGSRARLRPTSRSPAPS